LPVAALGGEAGPLGGAVDDLVGDVVGLVGPAAADRPHRLEGVHGAQSPSRRSFTVMPGWARTMLRAERSSSMSSVTRSSTPPSCFHPSVRSGGPASILS